MLLAAQLKWCYTQVIHTYFFMWFYMYEKTFDLSSCSSEDIENLLKLDCLPYGILNKLSKKSLNGYNLIFSKIQEQNINEVALLLKLYAKHGLLSKALFEKNRSLGSKKITGSNSVFLSLLEQSIDCDDNHNIMDSLLVNWGLERRESKRSILFRIFIYCFEKLIFILINLRQIKLIKKILNVFYLRKMLTNNRYVLNNIFNYVFSYDDKVSQKLAVYFINKHYIDVNAMYSILGESYLHAAIHRQLTTFIQDIKPSILIDNLEVKDHSGFDIYDLAIVGEEEGALIELNKKLSHFPVAQQYIEEKTKEF